MPTPPASRVPPTGTTPAAPPARPSIPVLVPGDALRAVACVSVVVGFWSYGPVAGALFLLVLGATMAPRALSAPLALDLSLCATTLVAAWAAELDWYLAVSWLDVVVHAATTGLVAATGYRALLRLGAVADPAALSRPRLGGAVVTAAVGIALATLWEFGEWFGHTYLDDRIQVGYTDTVGDLAAGTAGSVVAAVLLARSRPGAGARA